MHIDASWRSGSFLGSSTLFVLLLFLTKSPSLVLHLPPCPTPLLTPLLNGTGYNRRRARGIACKGKTTKHRAQGESNGEFAPPLTPCLSTHAKACCDSHASAHVHPHPPHIPGGTVLPMRVASLRAVLPSSLHTSSNERLCRCHGLHGGMSAEQKFVAEGPGSTFVLSVCRSSVIALACPRACVCECVSVPQKSAGGGRTVVICVSFLD